MKNDRAVSKEEGKALATEMKAKFLEISAKENTKVKDAFNMLLKSILEKNEKGFSAGKSNATGVFGGGKTDPLDDENTKSGRKSPKVIKANSSKVDISSCFR